MQIQHTSAFFTAGHRWDYALWLIWWSQLWGPKSSIFFYRFSIINPSILGYHYFWKHPCETWCFYGINAVPYRSPKLPNAHDTFLVEGVTTLLRFEHGPIHKIVKLKGEQWSLSKKNRVIHRFIDLLKLWEPIYHLSFGLWKTSGLKGCNVALLHPAGFTGTLSTTFEICPGFGSNAKTYCWYLMIRS